MSDQRGLLQQSLAAIERLQARLDANERARHEPIAIVGAGCRYPGGVQTPEDLWRVVRDGVDAVSDVPPDRWDVNAYYDPDPQAPGKMVTRRAGFLSQVDTFDAPFFGISPREASTMDPQQRLLLETAHEALESAGIATDRLAGTATGVFVGITTSDYGQLVRLGGPEHSDVYSATGTALNAAAGRVSFTYGFQGPCVAVDTACSSSLVAVHLACQSLRTGESDLALAGGVNVILSPDAMVLFSKWGMMAPDGACKTFDAAADGFVRAEGCAMIAMKRLADARSAGDPILAVIRGSAMNSDGRSSGLTVPNGPAQQAVLRKALADARLQPSDIDYVEAHGTGTPLGDPIEIEALGIVMRAGRSPERPLKIGSVKTNLGHTEAASGLAGLLKVVMALRHEALPPHLHFSRPNPGIPWADLPITVPTTVTPWPRSDRPRRAGVSSFGFSGTNAHVIVEEAPAETDAEARVGEPHVIVLSARSAPALRDVARQQADHLAQHTDVGIDDLAATLAVGRAQYEKRLAFVGDSAQQVRDLLARIARGETPPGVLEGQVRLGERPKVAFLFTGQGAQYAGMSRGLYEREPVFRDVLDSCAAILKTRLDRPLLDVLFPVAGLESLITETAYTQPALFAVEYALSELWRSWGITPSIVCGHSVGEYVAACVAGVFSLEDGLSLIAERGRLMQDLPPGGGMGALFASESTVRSYLAAVGDRLAIAAVNGPEETVVSGDLDALEQLIRRCSADGLTARRLDVSHAFHSPRLDSMLDAFERAAANVTYVVPKIPLVSNVTGAVFPTGTHPDARYWRRHAREAVRFADGIRAIKAAAPAVLLEVGPHPTLLGLAAHCAPDATWTAVPSLRRGRDDRRETLASLASLFVRGAGVRWDAVVGGRGRRRALPTYPFQRERHWVPAAETRRSQKRAGHPLLGERLALATSPGTHVWHNEISLETHSWVTDHRVQGAAIVPATAYIEMTLQAGCEVLGDGALAVSDIEVLKPMILHEHRSRVAQVTLTLEGEAARIVVHSRAANQSDIAATAQWTTHATARVRRIDAPPSAREQYAGLEAARTRCVHELDGPGFYAALAKKGNEWGPCFQGMDRVWWGDAEAVGRVRVAPSLLDDVRRYRFHPAVSDACGHALVATVFDRNDDATAGAFVGGGVGEVRFYASPSGKTLWTRAVLRPDVDNPSNTVIGDVEVYEESGALISETRGARLFYLDDRATRDVLGAPENWFFTSRWQAQSLSDEPARRPKDGCWLIFADRAGVAEQIAATRRAAGLKTVLAAVGESWVSSGDRITMRADVAEDYRALLASVPDPAVILHLWTVGESQEGGATLSARLTTGPESVVHLLRAIGGAVASPRPRIWIATSGVHAVLRDDPCDAPWHAALWGLGKSLSSEHAELWGGLVDLPPRIAIERDAASLAREIEQATVDDKVAFRGVERYVPRLEQRTPPTTRIPLPVRADATYLLTGGLGGIGLAIATWFAENGARHLLLLGRTPVPDRSEWTHIDPDTSAGRRVAALRAIEAIGARVDTRSVDVADIDALQTCLREWASDGRPPVRGVIHAAGVLKFRAIESEDVAAMREACAAKIDGAWHLHNAMGRDLDLFVMCSSTSTVLNSPLLGGYAAANACLDSLAWHRRARGLSALSVNWGTWGEVGMAVESTRGGDMLTGISTLPTSQALAALRELIEGGDTQAAVMPVDWGKLARAYPSFVADPFLANLVRDVPTIATDSSARLSRADIQAVPDGARGELVREYLRAEVARVLGLDPDRLDPTLPLSSFGFDSLMAVQLKNRIETDLGAGLQMIEFLQGPSVDELSATVLGSVDLTTTSVTLAGAAGTDTWEEGSL